MNKNCQRNEKGRKRGGEINVIGKRKRKSKK
jgi:hypothetical protein